ncbi:small nuclear RNA activating complex, subunit SNAP43-domain-containing protein [Phycomyces blakesleeanus]
MAGAKKNSCYPNSTLDFADLLPISNRQKGVYRSAIFHDVDLLLTSFVSKDEHTYSSFNKVWNELEFVYVHFGCLSQDFHPDFMHVFFDAILSVIYALYFMYHSQPEVWEKIHIRVTPEEWKTMFDFYIYCCHEKIFLESVFVFKRLREEKAFHFTITTTIKGSNYLEQKEAETPNNLLDRLRNFKQQRIECDAAGINSNEHATKFKALAGKFKRAKEVTLRTPQATIAIKELLEKRANIKESNSRLLQSALTSSALAIDDNAFLEQLDTPTTKLWKERESRLRDSWI